MPDKTALIEYLSQRRWTDLLVKSKHEQITQLQTLANKAHDCISTGNISKLASYKKELLADIYKIEELKHKIDSTFSNASKSEFVQLLELRYVQNENWDSIAVKMNYSVENVHRLHNKALGELGESLTHSLVVIQ